MQTTITPPSLPEVECVLTIERTRDVNPTNFESIYERVSREGGRYNKKVCVSYGTVIDLNQSSFRSSWSSHSDWASLRYLLSAAHQRLTRSKEESIPVLRLRTADDMPQLVAYPVAP